MKIKKVVSLLLILFFFYFNGSSQQNARLRKLGLEDGLSQSTIYQIFQDSEGFIWIATQDGLNRYDGYQFTVYRNSLKNKQSISSNWINAIAEDSEGNIWVGTKYGLNRWNKISNNFTSFLPDSSSVIQGKEIKTIQFSKTGKLWFAHENGVGYYDVKTNKLFDYSSKYPDIPAFKAKTTGMQLIEDGFGKMWYMTRDSGAVVFERDIPKKMMANDKSELAFNVIWRSIIGPDGEVWMTSEKGLMHYNSEAQKFSLINSDEKSEYKIPFNDLNSVVFDDHNNLWIEMHLQGIVCINLKTKEQKHYSVKLTPNTIGADRYDYSFKDKNGNLWFAPFGTNAALTIFSPKTKTFKNYYNNGKELMYGLPATGLICFLVGRDGEVWIGTEGDGISVYNTRLENFKHVTKKIGADSTLDNPSVRFLLKDTKGRFWASTDYMLNLRLNETSGFINFPFSTTLEGALPSVNRLFEDSKKRVWIGTAWGVYSYTEKNKKFQKVNITPAPENNKYIVRYIYENNKKQLCIFHRQNLFAVFNDEKQIFETIDKYSFLKDDALICVKQINYELLFFGLSNGFYIYNEQTNKHKKYDYKFGDNSSISNPEVNDALVQNDSIIWIATSNGLNRFNVNTEKFKYYFIEDGLPNQFIYNLLRDVHGNIWMSSNKGISMLNPITEAIKNYDVNDGLQSNEFNGGAVCQLGNGLYFGGINGYNYFNPWDIKINKTPPLLYFSDLFINNKKITPGDETNILEKRLEDSPSISIPEGIVGLSIDFVALDFTSKNGINYFYSLEKNETKNSQQWLQLINQRSINISNPEYGDYLLKIKAVNKDGIESEIKQLEIHILPPFYETAWFRLFLVFAFVLIVIFIYRMRIKAIKKQKKELEKQVEERTYEVVEQRDEAEKQKKIAIQQKEEVAIQKEIIEIKNKEIVDSIHYAKRIQEALLQSEGHDTKHFPSHFILFKPKDIVSGDFYWALEKQEYLYVAAVDCTGHGVPGAFMSMLGIAYLNEINAGEDILSPATILDKLRNKIVENLSGENGENKDGMDMSLYKLNLKTNELEWSGSNNPLWIIAEDFNNYSDIITNRENNTSVFKKNETDTMGLVEIKADKQSIGYNEYAKPFTNNSIQLQKNDSIYIFTDGFADQFGGEKGKKFKYKSLKQLILDIENLSMEEQKNKMTEVFEKWRGPLEQIDDVCLIGLKV